MGASITPENLTVRYATPPNSEPNLTTINRLVLIRARRYRVAVRMLTQGSEFHRLEAAPWSTPMNDLGLVETVDRFGEGIVITVADTSDRRLDASFCQSLGIPNGHVLNAAIGVMHEAAAMSGTPIMKCLLQRIEDEACMCCPARPPADNAACKGIDDEGHVDEALPSRQWSKKRRCASPPRTVLAPFSAYGSPFKLGPWPLQHHDSST